MEARLEAIGMTDEPVDQALEYSAEKLEAAVLLIEDERDRRAAFASRDPASDEVPPPSDADAPPDEIAERRKRKKSRTSLDDAGETGHAGIGPRGGYRLTDLGNARRFADRFNNRLRFVPAWGQWLTWDKQRWRRDDLGAEIRGAKEAVAAIYAEAAQYANVAASAVNAGDTSNGGAMAETLARWASNSAKRPRIEAMVALARSEPELATSRDVFDRDIWALNVANGTIDLRDGELRPHRQGDMITMLAPATYDPTAEAPRWEAFLARALPDAQVRGWVQRYLGYALTGDVREQCLSFFVGGGANGKSVLLDVVLAILGDYGLRAAPDLVLARHGDAHPTELADLEGRRMVVCSEIEQGRMWAESVIKRITGDTTITARRMKQDFFTFSATHKLIIAANTRPSVRGTDHGIWRRMRLVPWTVQIPPGEQDRELSHRLVENEASGILAWLVRGCLAWQRLSLGQAAAIEAATGAYRADEDTLGRWIEDRCELGETLWWTTDGLYKSYQAWCSEEGIEKAWTRRIWQARMCERPGIEPHRTMIARGLKGVQLRGNAQLRHDA
jgi:putative DNA primase/helicase